MWGLVLHQLCVSLEGALGSEQKEAVIERLIRWVVGEASNDGHC